MKEIYCQFCKKVTMHMQSDMKAPDWLKYKCLKCGKHNSPNSKKPVE